MSCFGWLWAHLARCGLARPGEGQGMEGHGASAVPRSTWRGSQIHMSGLIQGWAAVGARLGHHVLNRGTYWSGLGAQPAPIRPCCQQAQGQGSRFGGWGPWALGAAERGRGETPGSQAAGRRPLPPARWSMVCGVALLTSTCDPPAPTHAGHPVRAPRPIANV